MLTNANNDKKHISQATNHGELFLHHVQVNIQHLKPKKWFISISTEL